MSYEYKPAPSTSRFYVPRTLISDFDEFLQNDIPGAVGDFVLLTDWYAQYEEGYEKTVIRGEIYPDATKSRYSNTDNNLNFRASKSSGIKKGDMIIDPEENVYLLDWNISPEPNNLASRALRCNVMLTFTRHHDDVVDDYGYLIEEAGDAVIADAIPCNAYRYDGRPEFSAVAGTPGVAPDALTLMSVQWNDKTCELKVDDEFVWGKETYHIIDVNLEGVNLKQDSGVLTLQAKKRAGGDL